MPALPFLPAEPLQGGATSLSLAAGNGHEAVVRLLLDNKAEANLADQVHCSDRPGANVASKPFFCQLDHTIDGRLMRELSA
jgi:ankyrin repeat protein